MIFADSFVLGELVKTHSCGYFDKKGRVEILYNRSGLLLLGASQVLLVNKEPACQSRILGFNPWVEKMAIHSSILA